VSRSKPKKSIKAAPVVAGKKTMPETAAQVVDAGDGGRSWVRPWMMVAIVVLPTAAVRIHLLGIPLERDEGEYAYGGQLLLHGIPPYKLLYSMKFPGVYAAYALIMAVFGQTIIGIHVGFMLVNAATIVLVYLLGKRLVSATAGVAAAAAYALISMGQDVLGTQAHATHFVVLAALGGTLLLLRGIDNRHWPTLLWSGALYGIAILMKQHGVLFVAFGAVYLALAYFMRRDRWRLAARDLAIFFCGVSMPLVLTGIALWWAGVFDRFWFWTFTYARTYEQELSLTVFITVFLFFSFLAVCPGLYFRVHYFVLMLPAVALLAGFAVGTARKQWPRKSWMTYGLFAAVLVYSIVQQQKFLFRMNPMQASRVLYGRSPFPEAIKIADYIRSHTAKDASIAVLGSEPEIPFYADRRSASGYIYMYGLMEPQPYAVTMQTEFTRDIEAAQPEYVVFVMYQTSWMQVTKIGSYKILDWWAGYQPKHYKQLVGIADIIDDDHTEYRWDDISKYKVQSSVVVLIYKRTDATNDPMARLNSADALKAQEKLDLLAQENFQVFAITLSPKNYIAYNNLGLLLFKQGMREQALNKFQRSLIIKPDQAPVHYYMGRIFMEMNQLPQAEEELSQTVRLDPSNASAHDDLGVVLFRQGDYEKAVEQFSDTLVIDPAYYGARQNLAAAEERMKK
jgi:Tfp pilus assembly protein PilF